MTTGSAIGTLVLASGCALLVWATLFYAIPWMAQRAAVYGLHGLRDRLAQLADAHPWLRRTLIFRDADFVIAVHLRLTRDCSYYPFLDAIRDVVGTRRASRGDRYADDIAEHFGAPEGQRVLAEISRILDAQGYWLLLRVTFGHAAAIPFSVLLVILAFLREAYRSLAPEPDVPEKLTANLRPMTAAHLRPMTRPT